MASLASLSTFLNPRSTELKGRPEVKPCSFIQQTWITLYKFYHISVGAQSCLTLCDPMECSPPGSSVHGIFQARILEWVAISFSSSSSQIRDRTHVSCLLHWQADSLPLALTGKSHWHDNLLMITWTVSLQKEISFCLFFYFRVPNAWVSLTTQ